MWPCETRKIQGTLVSRIEAMGIVEFWKNICEREIDKAATMGMNWLYGNFFGGWRPLIFGAHQLLPSTMPSLFWEKRFAVCTLCED